MSVKIIQGNCLEPIGDGKKVIVQSCNDLGVMGSGIAKSILDKWPVVKEKYTEWSVKTDKSFRLGEIQFVLVEEDILICNIIGQKGLGFEEIDGVKLPAVRYFAIFEALLRLRAKISKWSTNDKKGENYNPVGKVSIHMPLIGAGLALGSINQTYQTIWDVFGMSDYDCYIYAFSHDDMTDLRRCAINFSKHFQEVA
jgi:O-acetyl-ADP-ribose deacetylase (regulator of RNase III)